MAKMPTFAISNKASPARQSTRRQRGFTLIELLVTFSLLALILGVVPFAFDRYKASSEYRNTVRTLLSELRTARAQSLAYGRESWFRMDLQARTYGIVGQKQYTVPESINIKATVASLENPRAHLIGIRFLPQGGATGGSIDVVRASGAGTRLRVDWLSGQVQQEALAP